MCAIKRSPGRLFDDKLEPGNGKAHLWYPAVFDSSVVLVRLLVGALKCPFVSNSDSFQYFATEHAGLYQALLQEAKQLDMQLASFAMIMLSLGLLVIYTMKSEKKIAPPLHPTEDTAAKPTWRIGGL